MRVKHKLNVQVFDDADGKNKLFAMDDTLSEVILEGFQKFTAGKFSVTGGANENLSIGDITDARGFWIEADGEFDLKVNGAAVALRIKPGATGGKAKGALECVTTSLNIAAPTAGVTVTGKYVLWGDPS